MARRVGAPAPVDEAAADPRRIVRAAIDAAGDDPAALAAVATGLLADVGWIEALLAPDVARLAADPWHESSLRASRDPLRIGARLLEHPRLTIAATVLSADALAAAGPPRRVAASGRVSIVRYHRAAGATLDRWDARGERLVALPPLALHDGAVLRLDGRIEAHCLRDARSDVVMVTAQLRSDGYAREYALPAGTLLRTATHDGDASRAMLLLTALRCLGRRDAAASFDAATRAPAHFLRWQAMREWLALDAAAAWPRLAAMADDPHPDVAAAARATLARHAPCR